MKALTKSRGRGASAKEVSFLFQQMNPAKKLFLRQKWVAPVAVILLVVFFAPCWTISAHPLMSMPQATARVKAPADISGTYSSERGTVVLMQTGTSIRGYWLAANGKQGTIESGTLDGENLSFHYIWGDHTGTAVFTWSGSEPPRWEGNFRHSDGMLGGWNLTRTGNAPAGQSSIPPSIPRGDESSLAPRGQDLKAPSPPAPESSKAAQVESTRAASVSPKPTQERDTDAASPAGAVSAIRAAPSSKQADAANLPLPSVGAPTPAAPSPTLSGQPAAYGANPPTADLSAAAPNRAANTTPPSANAIKYATPSGRATAIADTAEPATPTGTALPTKNTESPAANTESKRAVPPNRQPPAHTAGKTAASPLTVQGYAEWRRGDLLVVDGQSIRMDRSTKFKGGGEAKNPSSVPLGYEVKVKGVRSPEGIILASEMEAGPNGNAMFKKTVLAITDDMEKRWTKAGRVYQELSPGKIKMLANWFETVPASTASGTSSTGWYRHTWHPRAFVSTSLKTRNGTPSHAPMA